MNQEKDKLKTLQILIRYHEIAIKKANREWFEERLEHNLRKLLKRALPDPSHVTIQRHFGRIVVNVPDDNKLLPTIHATLKRTFGIANYSLAYPADTSIEAIQLKASELFLHYLKDHPIPKSFRILTRRSEKALVENSMQIDRAIGSHLRAQHPLADGSLMKVDLEHPEFTLGIEIRNKTSYLWHEKISGVFGLPVGTNGKVLCLISGGIDSIVAAIQTQKRGTHTHFIYFHGDPFVGPETLHKVEDLARLAHSFLPETTPFRWVSFGKIQEEIALKTHPKIRTILYRRMMLRIAARIAKNMKCLALVTGESLAQVASQTLDNLTVIDQASPLPILRPLICHDKAEIIELAKKYGSFELSIRAGDDCCTLFADKHPCIRANLEQIEEAESVLDIESLIQKALNSVTVVPITPMQ